MKRSQKKSQRKFTENENLCAKEKYNGADGFESYYAKLFGERWQTLKAALSAPVKHFELSENLRTGYFLDKASFFAASLMPPLDEGVCLDMCAAPGGKSLVLATRGLQGKAELQTNELSASRRARLRTVLEEHLSPELRTKVSVSGYDGSVMCKLRKDFYERILLDAPCSSERHVLADNKYLSQWSEARIKNLARRQWALLSSAFLMLKTEGFLLYSTCALSEAENDCVIDKLIEKYPQATLVPLKPFEHAEPTRHGLIFLPDTSGYGPLYCSLVKKDAKTPRNL